MADDDADQSSRTETKTKTKTIKWRPWLRAIHRDAGYLVIGVTIVYAVSGLAVNHIGQWDPNFVQIERTHQVSGPFPEDDQAAAQKVIRALAIDEKPNDVFRDDADLEIAFEHTTLTVNTETGAVLEQGQKPRWFLRAANWLHLNRGKKAWTYFADAYAVLLLYLALSGIFMIPGRKGFLGRGAVLTTLGAAVPIGYLVFSGGP